MSVEFVKRPGLGTRGTVVNVRANYFEVKNLPEDNIHQYDVTITPEVPPALNRKAFNQIAQRFGRLRPVYDGRKNIFSAKPLPFGDAYTFHNVTITDPRRVFVVRMKKVAEINMAELQRFLDGRCAITENILTG